MFESSATTILSPNSALAGFAARSDVDSLSVLLAAADRVIGSNFDDLSEAELGRRVAELHRLTQRLEGERLRTLREFDARQAWLADGSRSAKGWLADACDMTPGEALGDVHTARALAQLPRTAARLAEGTLSLRHARLAARTAREVGGSAAYGPIDELIGASDGVTTCELRDQLDSLAHDLDAERLARGEHDAFERRRLTARRLPDGSVGGEYRVDPIDGEAWLTALNAAAAPRGADDDRTQEQRNADALAHLAWQSLDRGRLPERGGERPHIGMLTTPHALKDEAGADPARLDFAGAISNEQARMLACDASIRRVVMGGRSEPLNVGRASRNPTAAQRRAVIARDRHCVGCGAPAGWCVVHHVKHWVDGGPTDLCNLVLLCRACHRKVHLQWWTIARGEDGAWSLLPTASSRFRRTRRQRAATTATVASEHRPAYR